MFGTIRRHQTWLWAIIVTLTVVSFVVFFNPNNKYSGRNSGSVNLGAIDGEPVTREAYQAAAAEVQLSYFLGHGDWPDHDPKAKQSGYNEQREIYQRLFLAQKQKDLNIHISHEAIGIAAAQILHSLTHDGSALPLEDFEVKVLQPHNLTQADFARMIEHELAVREMIAALGLTGKLTTPQEAEMLLRHEREEITAEVVFFSATNYLSSAAVAPETLGQFFTNQMARYRVPDRRQVSYLRIKTADFTADADAQIAKITNFPAQVDALYLQRGGTNYYKDLTPDAAKKEIRAEIHDNFALRAARNQAAEFTDELLNLSPVQPDNLAKLAAQKNLTAGLTAPFTAEAGPTELDVPATFAKAAFALTADEPFAGPIVADDAVYVIGLKNTLPSEIPAFDSIHDKVLADYQLLAALQTARTVGTNFAQTITSTPMKTFAGLCAAARLTDIKLPAFSLTTRTLPEVENHLSFGQLQEIAYGLPTGNTTGFISTREGGLVLHVISRTPASDTVVQSELPAFLAQVRQTRQNEAFNAWFSRAAQTGLRDTPLAKPTAVGQP